MKPKARKEDILAQETDGETLIFDLATDKAYLLNKTSTFVWQNCDGRKSVQKIAGELARKNNQPINEEIVWLALDQLKSHSLITEIAPSEHLAKISQREMIKQIEAATMIDLPQVTELIVPMAANS